MAIPSVSMLGTSARTAQSSAHRSPSTGAAIGGLQRNITNVEVLRYVRSAFTDDMVLDSVPLEAAGNPGAWHAWRAHRRKTRQLSEVSEVQVVDGSNVTALQSVWWCC